MGFDEDTLRKLKKVQLLTLLEIKRICDKYDIKYTPIGGTLLGTIRHQGFIPWDDDIDVGMLRSEYNRFIEAAKKELRPEFFLQTYETDEHYPKAIARICVNDTIYAMRWDDHTGIHKGVFTDVFPYDNSPDSKIFQKIHKYSIYWLHLVTYYKYNYVKRKSLKAKVGFPVLSLPFILADKLQARILYEKSMQKYNKRDTEYVVRTGSGYPYEKVRVKRHLMEEVETRYFEGKPISVMVGYHEHLSDNYGDYMQLPPVEKRRNVQLESTNISLGIYDDEVYLDKCISQYS